jgi:hypothetical protein
LFLNLQFFFYVFVCFVHWLFVYHLSLLISLVLSFFFFLSVLLVLLL